MSQVLLFMLHSRFLTFWAVRVDVRQLWTSMLLSYVRQAACTQKHRAFEAEL